ncbi:MAG: energy transducer TonB [Paludibacter sp.]|jgi:antitoxin component YwqK of YwqJK toxin-antitoxin module|nr:energy transducer TonB [Paludibacter sp.]
MNRLIPLKKIYFLVLLFVFSQMNAQKTEKFFDFRMNECKPNVARFYSLVVKTDSGYCRKDFYIRERKLQMYGNYKDSLLQIPTGKFYYFHANGSPKAVGKYVNGEKEELWLSFHINKMLSDSTVYIHGKQIGTSLSWYPNGYLSDSIYTNEDGSGYSVSWFDNGSISSRGKYSAGHKQDGLWKYYHINGKNSSLETYSDSKLIDKKYFDEDGIQMNDTTNHDKPARFIYNDDKNSWLKYLDKKIYYPFNQKIINGDTAVVTVDFTVNEDGMVENVYTSTTFSERFDREAENAIKESPQWDPAIEHNRKVKCRFKQVVTFSNSKRR